MAGRDRAQRPRRSGSRGPRRLRDVGLRCWRNGAMTDERDVERLHAVMSARTVPRNRLEKGTVVLARVPFARDSRGEDATCRQEREKVRPAVVVEVSGDACTCRPCTSSASRHRLPWAHTELEDLESAGLSRATGVKRREVVVSVRDCIVVCGVLANSDLERVFDQVCGSGSEAAAEGPRMSVVADTVFFQSTGGNT